MTTEGDLQAAIDANPDDWNARLVLADFLQDRDDPRAEGYRWLARERKRPRAEPISPPKALYDEWIGDWVGWDDTGYFGSASDLSRALLALVARANEMPNWNPLHHAYFRTRRAAEDAVALALFELPQEVAT